MPVFHPNGLAVRAMPLRRGFLAMLVEIFRETRALERDAYRRGLLINR